VPGRDLVSAGARFSAANQRAADVVVDIDELLALMVSADCMRQRPMEPVHYTAKK